MQIFLLFFIISLVNGVHHHRRAVDHDFERASKETEIGTTNVDENEQAEAFQRKIFQQLDANKDEKISADERKKLMNFVVKTKSRADVARIVEAIGNDSWNFHLFAEVLSGKVFHPSRYNFTVSEQAKRQIFHGMQEELELAEKHFTESEGRTVCDNCVKISAQMASDLLFDYNWRGEMLSKVDANKDHMVSLYEFVDFVERNSNFSDYIFLWQKFWHHSNLVGRLDAGENSLQTVVNALGLRCKKADGCRKLENRLLYPKSFHWNKDGLDKYECYVLASALFYDQPPLLTREKFLESVDYGDD